MGTKSGVIQEQMKLCDDAIQAMKKYHQSIGVLPADEVEALRQRAEFLFGAVQTYMAKEGTPPN